MELESKTAQEVLNMKFDNSYMLPLTVDILYQVEPELKEIAAKALTYKGRKYEEKLEAYDQAKREAERLIGWLARNPLIRNSETWDCFFDYVLDQLHIAHG